MADFDGSPDPGWTGWQRIAVGVASAIIGVTAILLVLFVFEDEEEVVPEPSTTSTTAAVTSTSTTGA